MANRNEQKFGMDAIARRLSGVVDHSGPVGMMSRGKNVYAGGSSAATRGGGHQFGRPKGSKDKVPMKSAINRRLARSKGK